MEGRTTSCVCMYEGKTSDDFIEVVTFEHSC